MFKHKELQEVSLEEILRKYFLQELSQKTKNWEMCNTGSVATFPSNLHGSSKGRSTNMPACHRKLWELFHGHA
jgi:hypothetical protein